MNEKLVEVLVFDGCPSIDVTVARVRAALEGTKVPAELRLVRIEDEAHAQRLRFLGSPTVRVDGIDIDPSATQRDGFGLRCRIYSVDGRLDGAPPAAWVTAALRGEEITVPASAPASCCSCGGN